jgi:hypothetical protein
MNIQKHVEAKKMTGDTPAVRARQRIEQKIALTAVKQLLAEGYLLGVNDGEETTVHHSRDASAIEAALFTTDEDYIYVYIDADQDDPLNVMPVDLRPDYWVRLVYGNDGWDVISDYSVALEIHLSEAHALATHYETY